MRAAAALSRTGDGGIAAAEAADVVGSRLGAGCRLALVFASSEHADDLESIAAAVEARLEPGVVLGAIAEGVIGPGEEVESGPAVSVWAADLDGTHLQPFRSWSMRTPDGGIAVAGWPDPHPDEVTLVFADPHSFPAAEVIARISDQCPGHRIVGGLLSGAGGRARLLVDNRIHDDGAVGVVLPASLVRTVVSHGCRPIGTPLTVTAAERNRILGLAGETATSRVAGLLEEVDAGDRALLRAGGLQIGLVTDAQQDQYETGDFRIRGVLGIDADDGAVTIGDLVEVGQVVQFQVRDRKSASEDLRIRMADIGPAAGGLLFTCNGRGRGLFGVPDHDVRAVEQRVGGAVAGAFCAGEIGPVGHRNELHGFTASAVILG